MLPIVLRQYFSHGAVTMKEATVRNLQRYEKFMLLLQLNSVLNVGGTL